MRAIHGLKGDTVFVTVETDVFAKLLDSLEEFLQKLAKELVLRKSKPQEACADDDIERDCVTPGGPDYNSSSNSICDESDFDDEWYSDCKRRKVPNQWIPERFDAHFEPLFDKKVKIRKTAWNYLFPVIQKSELK